MEERRTIRVLVVDDSAFMRKTISEILNETEDIKVVATARDGLEAIRKVADFRPDVITLDIEMPKLEGLQTLGYIMSECPTPVVMLSAYTESGGEMSMKALEYGAVDFVCKPSGPISLDLKKVSAELVGKVRTASQVDVSHLKFLEYDSLARNPLPAASQSAGRLAVVVAASTGGPRALYEVLPRLPGDLPAAVLIVQHMAMGFTRSMAERLDQVCGLSIKEAAEGDVVLAGHAYLAPGGYHMTVVSQDDREIIQLNQNPPRNSVRPAADETMESVARVFGPNALGVILTGMGHDGTQGALAMKKWGGAILVEDASTCVVFGMPRSAIEAGAADGVYPLDRIAEQIVKGVHHLKSLNQK